MRLLPDTLAVLWRLADDRRLGQRARQAIAQPDNLVYVSAATAWEIALKRALARLAAPGDIGDRIERNGFSDLAIELEHAVASAALPRHHGDPFDRLLVAQARIEDMTLVTADEDLARDDVARLDACS
ncbi:MAG TPA: type II toxin-antitoxin system VapC family toxin [Gaiellaceae bacterium]|nr:type II toxin-antitoxin system VapC family toxin [Gaiellaceae bacterium]